MKRYLSILLSLPFLLSSCAVDVSLTEAKKLASSFDATKLEEKSGSITTVVNSLTGVGEHGLSLKEEKIKEGFSQGLTQIKNVSDEDISTYLVNENYLEDIASKNDYDLEYIIDNKKLTIKRNYTKKDSDTFNSVILNIKFDSNGLLMSYQQSEEIQFSKTDFYSFSYTVYSIWNY